MGRSRTDVSCTSAEESSDIWMLEDLHKLRAYADMMGMSATKEALRISIIHTARELGTPTGLSILELAYGLTPMPNGAKLSQSAPDLLDRLQGDMSRGRSPRGP